MSEFKNTGVDFWLWDIILPALVGAAVGLLCLLLGLLFAFWMLTRQLRKPPEESPEEPDPPKMEAGSGHNFDRGSGAEDYESDVRAFGFGFRA